MQTAYQKRLKEIREAHNRPAAKQVIKVTPAVEADPVVEAKPAKKASKKKASYQDGNSR